MSAIDLTISILGIALRISWEVLPNTRRSYHQWHRYNQAVIPHWFFSKANWEQFQDVCLERMKSNPWSDEECREALKVRWALDKRVQQSRGLSGETMSALWRSQAKARRLLNQNERQSWAESCQLILL